MIMVEWKGSRPRVSWHLSFHEPAARHTNAAKSMVRLALFLQDISTPPIPRGDTPYIT